MMYQVSVIVILDYASLSGLEKQAALVKQFMLKFNPCVSN